jgi:hypothetical protein
MSTKNFTTAVKALAQFLEDNSDNGNKYYVVGYSKQRKNAEDIEGRVSGKLVQVFHSGGSFPRDENGNNTESTYDAVATVRMTVAASSKIDLAVLNSPSSTDQERMDALEEGDYAEQEANDAMDDLFGDMFDLIMGGNGEWFGGAEYSISDRWGHDFKKETALKKGSIVVVNGYYDIGFKTREIPVGDTPIVGDKIVGEVDVQDGNGDNLVIETDITQS